jgi:hypothetical protein
LGELVDPEEVKDGGHVVGHDLGDCLAVRESSAFRTRKVGQIGSLIFTAESTDGTDVFPASLLGPSPRTDEPGTCRDSMCQLNDVEPSSPIRRRVALKTVQLPAAEGHQNRYVWKIIPNLNGTPETL